ncbi:MAG: ComF family protein [Planctomycetales bacterium]|nr:ComF family protein [Planctomycetales bacterium]
MSAPQADPVHVPRPSSWWSALRDAAIDFVYPPTCPFCQAELPADMREVSGGFCLTCWVALTTPTGSVCRRCGGTVGPYLDVESGCIFCQDEAYVFDRVYRLGLYDGVLGTACLWGKHRRGDPLLAALVKLLCQSERGTLADEKIDVVVPIPQHWLQRLYRSHNAPDTLATVFASRLRTRLGTHTLQKTRFTPRQGRLGPQARRINMKNAFRVAKPASVAGATVLLVDDVMTTGATVNEAAKVIRQAGAKRVVVAVLARGLGIHR